MMKKQALTKFSLCYLFLILFFIPAILFSQKYKIKYGKIPIKDLQMKEFPPDSNAAAIILADIGEVIFEGEFNIVYTHYRRIKILSKTGYDWANAKIPFYAKDNNEKVAGIKGQTWFLDEKGKVKKTKLNRKLIFDEDVDSEYCRKLFTLPAISPGCVIEYQYRIHSKYPHYLHDWTFQLSEPVLWSEMRVDIPAVLDFVILKKGLLPYSIEEKNKLPWPPTISYSGMARKYNLIVNRYYWVIQDIPALRKEPYMTTPEDFQTGIEFQLKRIVFPGVNPQEVMSTWDKLAETLAESNKFGRRLKQYKLLKEQAIKITEGCIDNVTKMRVI
jgi:hypothetical protein